MIPDKTIARRKERQQMIPIINKKKFENGEKHTYNCCTKYKMVLKG